MDASILLRLLPAIAVAVAVAYWIGRPANIRVGAAVDEVLRVLLVGVVAGRIGWVAFGGPAVWRAVPSTIYLLRAGVTTAIGAAVAIGWVAWRADDDRRPWLLAAAPAATLAGVGVWQGLCGIEGVCAGVPVSWGVRLPGYLSPVFPAGYVDAAVALGLALLAYRWRWQPARAVGVAATYVLARALLGFSRASLSALPTQDQLLSAALAVALALVALRLRGRHLTLSASGREPTVTAVPAGTATAADQVEDRGP